MLRYVHDIVVTIPITENPAARERVIAATLGAAQWKKLTTSTQLEGYRVTATRFVCQHRAERDVTRNTWGSHSHLSLSLSLSLFPSHRLSLCLFTRSPYTSWQCRSSDVRTRSKEGSEQQASKRANERASEHARDEALYRANQSKRCDLEPLQRENS